MSYYQKGVKSAESNCFVVKKHGNLGQTHVCYQKDFIFTSHGQQQCKERVVTTIQNTTVFPSLPFLAFNRIVALKMTHQEKDMQKNCLYFLLEIKTIMNNKSYVKQTKKYLSVKKDRINYQNEKNKNKSSYLKKG